MSCRWLTRHQEPVERMLAAKGFQVAGEYLTLVKSLAKAAKDTPLAAVVPPV